MIKRPSTTHHLIRIAGQTTVAYTIPKIINALEGFFIKKKKPDPELQAARERLQEVESAVSDFVTSVDQNREEEPLIVDPKIDVGWINLPQRTLGDPIIPKKMDLRDPKENTTKMVLKIPHKPIDTTKLTTWHYYDIKERHSRLTASWVDTPKNQRGTITELIAELNSSYNVNKSRSYYSSVWCDYAEINLPKFIEAEE